MKVNLIIYLIQAIKIFLYLECKSCSANCIVCDSFSVCTHCFDTFLLRTGGSCEKTCPGAHFVDKENKCQTCSSNCQNCSSGSKCITCMNQTILYNSSCWKSCPNGTFFNQKTCESCAPICETCSSNTYCLSCKTDYHLVKNGNIRYICF